MCMRGTYNNSPGEVGAKDQKNYIDKFKHKIYQSTRIFVILSRKMISGYVYFCGSTLNKKHLSFEMLSFCINKTFDCPEVIEE